MVEIDIYKFKNIIPFLLKYSYTHILNIFDKFFKKQL